MTLIDSIDSMHQIYKGLFFRMLNLYLSNCKGEYYISKQDQDKISKLLEKIKPPRKITRRPRKFDSINFWKAKEIRFFFLYILEHAFKNVLEKRL